MRSTSPDQAASRWVLIALSMGFGLVVLDSSVLSVALPSIGRDLDGSLASLQWVANAYMVTFAGFMLSAGRCADRWGARRALLVGIVVFLITSLLCAVAWSLPVLIVGRLLQGVGGALVMTTSVALLTHTFAEGQARAKAFATMNLCGTVGLSAGPVIGGALIELADWRWIFGLNLVVGTFLLLALRQVGTQAQQAGVSLDLAGQVSGVVMLVGLAVALIEGGAQGWAQPVPMIGSVVAVVGLLAFISAERRQRDPMLPLSLLRISSFAGGSLGCGAWRFSLYGLLFFLSLHFQDDLGYSSGQAGMAFLPATAMPLVTNALSAPMTRRFGARSTATFGFGLAAAGAVVLLMVQPGSPYAVVALGLALVGAGGGAAMPAIGNVALADVPKRSAGVASGVFSSCGQVGALVGIGLLGGLASEPGLRGLHVAAAVVATVLVATAVVITMTTRLGTVEASTSTAVEV